MKALSAFSVVFLLMAAPALAVFDVGTIETFDGGLSGWYTRGDVAWSGSSGASSLGTSGSSSGDRVTRLGRRASSRDSRMWCYFVAPTSGEYAFSFDYKFAGVDNAARTDDIMSAELGDGTNNAYGFESASSTGLTGNQWRTVNSQPIALEAGQRYMLAFNLNESRGGGRRLVTALDIDNVNVSSLSATVRAIPTPGAVLLASLGAGLVGWLRSRRVL